MSFTEFSRVDEHPLICKSRRQASLRFLSERFARRDRINFTLRKRTGTRCSPTQHTEACLPRDNRCRTSARVNMSSVSLTLARMESASALRVAMIQYGKAVSALQQYIKDVLENQTAVEPVLIACLLLTCYEILIDRKGTAFSHYERGRSIVE
jgi:hypothetical protein